MTLGEKLEQRVTGRPNSHVPARVLERLAGPAEQPQLQPLPVNWAMHPARSGPGPGQRHAALRPGRESDDGPLRRATASA
jgi:hypothetical protein